MKATLCTRTHVYQQTLSFDKGSLPFKTEQQTAIMAQSMLDELPTAEYPYLAELTASHVLQPGYNYANEFEFGLDLLLDALGRKRD